MKRAAEAVSFRLGHEDIEALRTLADKAGLSVGALARVLVLKGMEKTESGSSCTGEAPWKDLVVRLEEKLGLLAFTVLTEVGKLDENQVRSWVEQHFLEPEEAG